MTPSRPTSPTTTTKGEESTAHASVTAPSSPDAPVTHAHEGPVVVFNIGMTIRRPHRPDLWLPAFTAMPRMVAELERNQEAARRGEAEDLGLIGSTYLLGSRGPWVVQYWRSTEHLYAYAQDRTRAHLPAWKAFNSMTRAHPGAVGVWHETLAVPAEGIESIAVGGSREGLMRMAGVVPVGRRGRRARQRLGSGLRPAG